MTLDELLTQAEAGCWAATSRLRQSMSEVAWAHDDLKAGKVKLPADVPPGRSLESCFTEVAARAVLPNKLPAVKEALEQALAAVTQLLAAVEPLPTESPK